LNRFSILKNTLTTKQQSNQTYTPTHILKMAATLPTNMIETADKLQALAGLLNDAAKTMRAGEVSSKDDHAKLIDALSQARGLISQPQDDMLEIMTGVVVAGAIRLLVAWKAFENIPETGSISYADLAEKIGGELAIVRKLNQAHEP
jgi:hypothetical protein